MKKPHNVGYQPCGCRDCIDIAVGEPGALCWACEEAGCDGEGECSRDEDPEANDVPRAK